MSAALVYTFDYIAPGQTSILFVHGFTGDQKGVFDALPLDIGNIGTAYSPLFEIKLTQGEVSIHVDGSYARTTQIQNLAPFNATGAELFFIFA